MVEFPRPRGQLYIPRRINNTPDSTQPKPEPEGHLNTVPEKAHHHAFWEYGRGLTWRSALTGMARPDTDRGQLDAHSRLVHLLVAKGGMEMPGSCFVIAGPQVTSFPLPSPPTLGELLMSLQLS